MTNLLLALHLNEWQQSMGAALVSKSSNVGVSGTTAFSVETQKTDVQGYDHGNDHCR